MALSEPECGAFDPKPHLQPSMDGIELDSKTFEAPLQEHNFNDPPPTDSTISINNSAHQANSLSSTNDFAPPSTNGYHTSLSPLNNETQSSMDLKSSASGSADAAATQETSSEPVAQSALGDPPEAKADTMQLAPPIVQQPTSDLREAVQPEKRSSETEITKNSHEVPAQAALTSDSAILDQNLPLSEQPPSTVPDESDAIESTPAQEVGSERGLPPTNTEPSAQMDQAPINGKSNSTTAYPSHQSPEPLSQETSETRSDAAPTTSSKIIPEPVPQSDMDSSDQDMEDAPPPPKTGRAREEDDLEDAPAAKRAKIEEDGPAEDFKVPDRPQIDTEVSMQNQTTQFAPSPLTKPRQKHLQKALTNIRRNQAAKYFLEPVDPVALNIPTYFDVIKQPMDLKTIDNNIRADKYSTIDAIVADVNQIVQNSLTFNGAQHMVTKSAVIMQEKFNESIATLPSPEANEPAPSKKKAPDPMAIRAPPARRESRSSLPGSARSPGSATSPQTFALGPEGVPLIRRDSTIDGRPKREIHRPAPKDLPYTNQKPKKKKFQWELKFCDHALKEITKPKYTTWSFPFTVPVDPVALNIPNYLSVVKKPMDFGTMRQRLDRGEYENAREFEADARQVFKNCYLFNPESDTVHGLGKKFESVFNDEWSKKRDWLEENTPSSGQRSPASSEDEESEEEQEEEEDEDEGKMEIVSKLQKQIAEMSKQVEMITSGAKKKTPPTASKKAAKPPKAAKKDTKKSAPAPAKAEKKAAAKPARKEKIPYVTYEQKQDISNRINSLSESKMSQALAIIRSNMPNLKGVQEDELELDIDELSNDVLYKLLQFVRKHAPRPDDSPLPMVVTSSLAGPQRKKNKPMSKHEQEARIAQVQSGLSAFRKGSSPNDVQPSIERQSDDEDEEDSESEEE